MFHSFELKYLIHDRKLRDSRRDYFTFLLNERFENVGIVNHPNIPYKKTNDVRKKSNPKKWFVYNHIRKKKNDSNVWIYHVDFWLSYKSNEPLFFGFFFYISFIRPQTERENQGRKKAKIEIEHWRKIELTFFFEATNVCFHQHQIRHTHICRTKACQLKHWIINFVWRLSSNKSIFMLYSNAELFVLYLWRHTIRSFIFFPVCEWVCLFVFGQFLRCSNDDFIS